MIFTTKDACDLLEETEQYLQIIEQIKKDAKTTACTYVDSYIEDATRIKLEEGGFKIIIDHDNQKYIISWYEKDHIFFSIKESTPPEKPKGLYIALISLGISICCGLTFLLHLI